jgi:FkbM family methyltransferase
MVDPFEVMAIEQYIQPEQIIFDVGACIGEWSAKVIQHFAGVVIHAFEPSPRTYPALKKTFINKQNVNTNNIGLLNEPGQRDLHILGNKKRFFGTSCLNPRQKTAPNLVKHGAISVPMTTLDIYCAGRDIHKIHFCKIDVEGYEYAVMEGAYRLLRHRCIDVIQFEYGYTSEDSGYTWEMIRELLEGHEFQIGMMHKGGKFGPPNTNYEQHRHTNNYLAVLQ